MVVAVVVVAITAAAVVVTAMFEAVRVVGNREQWW